MSLLEEAIAVNESWADAIRRHDAPAAAGHFTDSGAVVVADTPVTRGRVELERLFQSWIDAGMQDESYANPEVEQFGDAILLTCNYRAVLRQANGDELIETGKNTQILKQTGAGDWQIHVLAITTNSVQ